MHIHPIHTQADNEDLHYDSHGNITTLQRTGLTPSSLIDDLSANYWPQTNRLKTVSDAQTSTAGFHDAHKAPSVNVSNSGSMQLIISQVHYNSEHQSPQNAAEFIEVMNISTQPVNLKNWVIDVVVRDLRTAYSGVGGSITGVRTVFLMQFSTGRLPVLACIGATSICTFVN
ncbi:MAG: lamin tail domain-containing protein [Bacteroidetes bacterium]|nr:lamin tail domain-containing protein [Bacteroidota bacterium]